MSNNKLACLILAAGEGKRMKSVIPKALHKLAGRSMIAWLLESVESLEPETVIVVRRPDAEEIEKEAKPHECAIQEEPRGTADAVKAGLNKLGTFDGDILILLGDMPLISAKTLRKLIDTRHKAETGLAVLGAIYESPPPFGRLVLNDHGGLARIVEDKDCSPDEKNITRCNTGAFCVDGKKLTGWLDRISCDNAQGELYITDLPEIAAQDNIESHIHIAENRDEVHGVNDRADLAQLEKIVQRRLRKAAMDNGVTLIDPESTYFAWDTKLGKDVTIEPNVFFGPGVEIGDDSVIKAFTRIEGAKIGKGSEIGPYAHIHYPKKPTVIGDKCVIGNFVEIKRSVIHDGVKAKHLAYIADAEIGAGVNFACGAITVNYDGFEKHKTVIGDQAMIGSNVNLIAPLEIGEGAFIAAGTTLGKDIPADALAIAREKPLIKDGWAAQNRKKKAG